MYLKKKIKQYSTFIILYLIDLFFNMAEINKKTYKLFLSSKIIYMLKNNCFKFFSTIYSLIMYMNAFFICFFIFRKLTFTK